MHIEVTINIPALDRFVDAMGAGNVALPAAKPAAAAPKAPAASGAAGKAPAAASAGSAPAASPTDGPTLVEIKAAAAAFSQANGRDALAEKLKAHGSTAGVSAVPEENRAAFLADVAV